MLNPLEEKKMLACPKQVQMKQLRFFRESWMRVQDRAAFTGIIAVAPAVSQD